MGTMEGGRDMTTGETMTVLLGGGPASYWILLYRFLGNVKSSVVGVVVPRPRLPWYNSRNYMSGLRKIRCFTVWRDASDRDES